MAGSLGRRASLLASGLFATAVHAKASVGNFAISSTECSLDDLVLNPPELEVFLTNASASAGFLFSVNSGPPASYGEVFAGAQGDVTFPVCRRGVVLAESQLVVTMNAFAPISPVDIELPFLPVLLAQFMIVNNGPDVASFVANYSLTCFGPPTDFCNGTASVDSWGEGSSAVGRSGSIFVGASVAAMGANGNGTAVAGVNCTDGASACSSLRLTIPPYGGVARGVIVIGYHSHEGRYAPVFNDSSALFRHAADFADALAAEHSAFVGAVPLTGDAQADQSVRWFLQAPILLTKGVRNDTLTMGYCELNSRDSFWSSWLHLLYWPTLDRDMIAEMAAHQQSCGKIPTTVLPVILRDDNVDTTEYFVLRVARHFQHTGNHTFLASLYPALERAMAYLKGRDTAGTGVPQALNSSFWADWLDVDYVQGRRYAPHFDLLWLAACKVAAQIAGVLGRADDAARYSAWYTAGYDFANAEFGYVYNATLRGWDATGLWNSTRGCYVDAWYDGRPVNWTYGDVAVGTFFGVVPADRVDAVDDWLHTGGPENQFGIRNVFPYLAFGPDPGTFGNGGIYPWFNCISVANRLLHGRPTTGTGLFAALTNNMLYRAGQPLLYTPFEYAHGDTGVDDGDFPQGWDGSCFLRASLGGWAFTRQSPVQAVPTRAVVSLGPHQAALDARNPFAGVAARDGAHGGDAYSLTLPHTLYVGAASVGGIDTTISLPGHHALLRIQAGPQGAYGRVGAAPSVAVVAGPRPIQPVPSVEQRLHGWAYESQCKPAGMVGANAIDPSVDPAGVTYACKLPGAAQEAFTVAVLPYRAREGVL